MVTWEPLGDFIWNDLYADDVYIYNYIYFRIFWGINSWEFHMKFPTIYSPKNPKITLGGRI